MPKEPQPPHPEPGSARASSALDITLPSSISESSAPPPSTTRWDGEEIQDPYQRATLAHRDARFHLLCSLALTLILVSWLIGHGELPAVDPTLGAALTILHLGAWMTAWLSFEGALTTYRILPVAAADQRLHISALLMVGTCTTLLVLHTAMVAASVLP